ncbi:C40 family peptidase [Paenibacillus tarimensis]|uniref:C40 family peptidase n=1 Tax=Paenibacillus tarimensis TaxID=416012 RepID=UPI001F252300|nr:C40 family peptidase [Paenibacillus tarimensis]MCF2942690.1 C40 family peptidase [Paenibacillus tarimensis]
MIQHKFYRKVMTIGLCAAIGFSALGFTKADQAAAASTTTGDKIIATGKKYLGVKYRFGAPSGVTYAFDCSSFTQYVYNKNGVKLPRTSAKQATKGKKVAKSNLKKGDLVFFKVPGRTGNKIGHVAIYAGSNKILHTYGKGGVTFSKLDSSYWKKNYVTARRVI